MIEDARVIAFCNGRLRHGMDSLAAAYWEFKRALADYNANDLGAVIANGSNAATVIDDGNTAKPITCDKALAAVFRMQDVVDMLEASSNAKLFSVEQVAPNP